MKSLRFLRNFISSANANVTVLVAFGLPMLVGGAGLAVDVAQWLLWKRELQYAVDQAALAGAWAQGDSYTRPTYKLRATQEFNANLQVISGFHSAPTVELANYNGGSENSVVVRANAGKLLPFSSFLTNRAITISAFAQASFQETGAYTSCLLAVDPDDAGAVTIGGNASVVATCGIAALSTSDKSIIVNGNPTVDVGWVLSKGGIDGWMNENTDDDIHEYLDGLYDPFEGLVPPNNPTPRSYACTPGATTTTADISTTVVTTYSYFKGSSQNTAAPYVYNNAKATSSFGPTTAYSQTVPNGTTAGSVSAATVTWTSISGNGKNTIWEVKTATTNRTYANVKTTVTPTQASLSPGTYNSIDVSCTTVFSSGVYVIDGGRVKITGQHAVTGSGVMFVLKNGAYFDFTGGSTVNLTAMTSSELEAAGVPSQSAQKLAGMLIFEDPKSKGTKNRNRLNGNSQTILNGKIYLPVSNITMDGTFSVTSQCLMIAAALITIQGTADLSTFCPPGMEETTEVSHAFNSVKLVS